MQFCGDNWKQVTLKKLNEVIYLVDIEKIDLVELLNLKAVFYLKKNLYLAVGSISFCIEFL